ncbi:flippase-like domain-containing protein [Belliella sp. DSM 107340]|uniref:Flippase-like domain-containing protein n=1 Tax=Belliella calami TaxID=2923436 RepID=A0ABS9UNC2_9BACT|nr:lysylphosphatidylglycerol synthase transmembrane domain-containing protein [Belliella calami]MCH7397778.1 flippase-like domain-containing protein [Belliella calami]
MKLSIKQWIQVILSLGVAIWIFWFLYKDISFSDMSEVVEESSILWLGISFLVSIFGFWLRAWRWTLLIDAGEDQNTSSFRAFWALMIGYLANLVVPRAGEVARCGVLKKTENIEMGKLIGTVIMERTIDFLFMLFAISLAFFLERDLFISLFSELVSVDDIVAKINGALPIIIGAIILIIILIVFLFKKYKENSFIKKVRNFTGDLVKGVVSLRKVKNQAGFWSSSAVIWLCYYATMFAVALAIPSTASLTANAVLMVMVMGSIGMTAPVQGGIGTFHALVAFILIRYGLSEEEGKIFAAIIHGSQVVIMIVLGLVALAIFFRITAKGEPKTS